MGKRAAEWVKENFAIEVVGKSLEEFIDSAPKMKYESYKIKSKYNEKAKIDDSLEDSKWVLSMYKLILGTSMNEADGGYKYWMQELEKGTKREDIDKYFREVAKKEGNHGGAPSGTSGEKSRDISDLIDEMESAIDESNRFIESMNSGA